VWDISNKEINQKSFVLNENELDM